MKTDLILNSRVITILLLIAFLSGCSSQQSTNSSALKSSYAKSASEIQFETRLFHVSENITKVYLKVSTDQLLYARRGDSKPTSNLLVEFNPKNTGDVNQKLQPKKIRITDVDAQKAPKTLLASTELELPQGSIYALEVTSTDVNRGTTHTKKITVNRSSQDSRENFIAFEDTSKIPLFKDRVKPYTDYTIKVNSLIKEDSLTVLYFNRIFKLPPPPFIPYEPEPFNYNPDSIFKFAVSDHNSIQLTTGASGFYHVLADPSQRNGFSLFISSSEFPEVQNVQNMIEPFRFLVGSKEYQSILESENQKKQIESFWIDWAGNKDRARKCIKAYYNGVEAANQYFSSHVEGWMSDRGLIYLVYGKPNKIYRTEVSESWIYGEENNPLSITFDFIKVNNPFTNNDYRLNRDEIFKPSWYRSVNAWRDGRIY